MGGALHGQQYYLVQPSDFLTDAVRSRFRNIFPSQSPTLSDYIGNNRLNRLKKRSGASTHPSRTSFSCLPSLRIGMHEALVKMELTFQIVRELSLIRGLEPLLKPYKPFPNCLQRDNPAPQHDQSTRHPPDNLGVNSPPFLVVQ